MFSDLADKASFTQRCLVELYFALLSTYSFSVIQTSRQTNSRSTHFDIPTVTTGNDHIGINSALSNTSQLADIDIVIVYFIS